MERLIAATGIVAEAAVRIEMTEDLTARALDRCVPLLDRDGIPEHIRAWTSAITPSRMNRMPEILIAAASSGSGV